MGWKWRKRRRWDTQIADTSEGMFVWRFHQTNEIKSYEFPFVARAKDDVKVKFECSRNKNGMNKTTEADHLLEDSTSSPGKFQSHGDHSTDRTTLLRKENAPDGQAAHSCRCNQHEKETLEQLKEQNRLKREKLDLLRQRDKREMRYLRIREQQERREQERHEIWMNKHLQPSEGRCQRDASLNMEDDPLILDDDMLM